MQSYIFVKHFLLNYNILLSIETREIIFYFLLAVLFITCIILFALFANRPVSKNNNKRIKENDYSEILIEDGKIFYSDNIDKRTGKTINKINEDE